MTYTLRDYQETSVDDLIRYFYTNPGHPIVAMPTGSGKSLVIAEFARRALEWGSRVVVATHVKELVEQDYEKLHALLPGQVGINSAGVGRRDFDHPIVCAGVQSIYRQAHRFQPPDLLLIDECHLVPHTAGGMYRTLIEAWLEMKPAMRVVGFTATPFRMYRGHLHCGPHRIFTDIAHSVDVVKLIDDGWLSPLVAKRAKGALDLAGIGKKRGEFDAAMVEAAADDDTRVRLAVEEIVERGADRRSWLVFACSVAHAHHVRQELERHGIRTGVVTGKTPKVDRERLIADYRDGVLRALVNVNVLTTGFDAPQTDLLAVLRPTESPVLYVQMMGRGMRIAPGKEDCLVLDFGGNVERHGPINNLSIRRGAGSAEGNGGDVERAPTRVCPDCDSVVHANATECPDCGMQFPRPIARHATQADEAEVVARKRDVVLPVADVSYGVHRKKGKPDSLKVTYLCGLRTYSEWVCLEHDGYAGEKARAWWRGRTAHENEAPVSVAEALNRQEELVRPAAIRVQVGGKYDRVIGQATLAPM